MAGIRALGRLVHTVSVGCLVHTVSGLTRPCRCIWLCARCSFPLMESYPEESLRIIPDDILSNPTDRYCMQGHCGVPPIWPAPVSR